MSRTELNGFLRRLRWSMPKNLEELRQDIKVELEKLTSPILALITGKHQEMERILTEPQHFQVLDGEI